MQQLHVLIRKERLVQLSIHGMYNHRELDTLGNGQFMQHT
jgi:hypothetical protein